MKKSTISKILFLSLVLSSCGLIEKFKTPEQPNDVVAGEEKTASTADTTDDLFSQTASEAQKTDTDDLFSNSINENTNTTATDAPTNVDSELKSLEAEFSSNGPRESVIQESEPTKPVIVEETIPEIKEEVVQTNPDAGTIQTYKVQKGETLMQIAFKLYGDIGKWKELKSMNKISSNNSLRSNMELKYRAPETPFVWNPAGVPYLIKNGDTLGIISNSVYSTPKKWKTIWENNKPLIKNPNVIFAGFTLYYKKEAGMANYVQPASAQPKKEVVETISAAPSTLTTPTTQEETIVETQQIPAAMDEATQTQAAPIREGEIDLINNVTAPLKDEAIEAINADDSLPEIDEEIQSLE